MGALPEPSAVRPEGPDVGVLRRAGEALIERGEVPGPVTWEALQRLDRPKSTVFLLEATSGGIRSRWHYKVDVVHHADGSLRPDLVHARRRSLEAEQALAASLHRAAEGTFVLDRALLVDIDRLVAVREHVPGRPLGRAVRWALPGRRGRAATVYRSIGRALRTFEEVGGALQAPAPATSFAERLDNGVASSVEILGGAVASRLHGVVTDLAPAIADDGHLWSHGDVSQTNVLVGRDRVGIIDASWTTEVPCWDLARLLMRIECEAPERPSWAAHVTDQVVVGYGADPADPGPQLRAAKLLRGLMGLRAASAKVRLRSLAWVQAELDR